MEDLVYGALHLEEYSTHGWLLHMEALMTWSFGWWRLGLDDVLWRFWFDGDLVDGGFATLMIWRQFLFYILPASWSLPPLRVGFLKPLLVGSKRTLAGSSKRVGTLISVGVEWSEKIEVFHITTTYCIKWFLSMNNDWVFHLYLVHFVYLVHPLLCIKD